MVMALIAIERPVDDAFIVFRYVDRFQAGKGLTFNDQEYVEGYTSLSWTLLLTFLAYTGLNPLIASLLVNYVFILLTGLTMYWVLLRVRLDMAFRLAALFFFSTSLLFFKVVYLGLELGMFIWLLMLLLGVFLESAHHPRRPPLILSGVLAALLFATRPEAVLIPPLLLLTCITYRRDQKNLFSYTLYFFIPFSTLFFFIVLWRLFYYGEMLPNSIIAKSISLHTLKTPGFGWLKDILIGSATYYFGAYKENPLLILVALLSIYFAVKKQQSFILILLLIPVAWQHFVILVNGGDWMPYYRFINLYTPLIIICLVVVLAEIVRTSRFFGALLFLIVACLHLYINFGYLGIKENDLQQALGTTPDDRWYEGDLYRALGESLNDVWIKKDVLIPEAIGNIGYYAPAIYIHDPSGLTDAKLSRDQQAQRSVYGRTDWYYSLGLNPAVILLHWWPQELSMEDLGNFDFYCGGPLPNSVDGASLYVLIRRDRVARYRTAIAHLGLKSIPSTDRESLKGAATLWCKNFLDKE
jgi:hypothetical protein